MYKDTNGNIILENAEELETTGISYSTGKGGKTVDEKEYSENKLRVENGLPRRLEY